MAELPRERQRPYIHWVTPQMAVTASAEARSQSFILVSHMSGSGTSTWVIFPCFPKHISKKLDWKWSSQYTNRHPYWMLVLQAEA